MGWGLWPAALGPLAGTQAFLWVSMAGKLWPGGRVLPATPRLTPGWLGLTSRSVGGQAGLVILEPRPPSEHPLHVLSLPPPARVRFAIENNDLYFFLLYFDKH